MAELCRCGGENAHRSTLLGKTANGGLSNTGMACQQPNGETGRDRPTSNHGHAKTYYGNTF